MTVTIRGNAEGELIRMNRAILSANRGVEHHEALVRRLRHLGRDTTRAEALLEVLRQSVEAMKRYQDLVKGILTPSERVCR
jgi:hypothetical protein